MAIRRLTPMLDALQNGGNMRADGGMVSEHADTGLQQANVLAVDPIAGATINVRGQSVPAAQATDEPLRAGALVWVSRAVNGSYVIYGSV